MVETNIAHAIGTFSELGIATGLVWIGDVVSFKTRLETDLVVAEESLRVVTEDYHAKADGFDNLVGSAIRNWLSCRRYTYSLLIKFLLVLLDWSPYVCILLGIAALFGISFYPTFASLDRDTFNLIYFVMAFLSFMAIFIPLIPKVTKKIINRYVLKSIAIK